jgi:hypothetical protein
MSRERLKDFLRTRGGGDMLNYVIDDGGDRSYDPGTDDLGVDNKSGQELRPLIRDFLSYVTTRNDYPIAPGGEEIVLTTPEGDPSPLEAAENTGAARVFVESNSLQEYSDSGQFTQFVGPTGFVDKTRGRGGNELLPGVRGTGLDDTGQTFVETSSGDRLPTVVGSVLQAENRYSPAENEQFAPRGTDTSEIDSRQLVIPSSFGEYSTTGTTVTFSELRKIGTSLLLKAAQIDTADTPNKSVRVDGQVTEEALSPLDVFNSRKRIDTRLFDATRADGSRQALAEKNKPLVTPADDPQSSYGTMNSPITPFDGPLPAGMMAQAAVGVGIVGGSTLVLSTILGLLPANRRENPVRGPYLPGRSDVPGLAEALAEMVGITPSILGLIVTRNPYIDCVKAGTLSFFGAGGGGVSSITGLAGSILQSPGYYVVIIRAILRSIIQLEEALKGFNNSGLSLQNLTAAVTFIDTLRRSKFIGYLNALAAIGDVLLDNAPSGLTLSPESLGITTKPPLDPAFPENRVMTSREGPSPTFDGTDYKNIYTGTKGRLSWRMGSAAAAYLIPKTIFQGEIGTTPTEAAVMKTNIIDRAMLNTSGRLPKDVVGDIEAYLDAEYVPFYFHDLRTNEVVGFHAFLDSLDDNYAVGYNSVPAFGRLDNVLQYGGTTRSLSFGFVIAATSEADFDEMWFRINKLVTLVYPQWSPGDEVEGTSRGTWSPKYKVPFSQVVSASPLIRVRIGDVIASNYSRFGLSRFFGATDNETILSEPTKTIRGSQARITRFDSSTQPGKAEDSRFYPPGSGFARSMSNIEEAATTMPVILKPSMGKNYTLLDGLGGLSRRPIKTYFPIRGEIDSIGLAAAYTKAKAAIDGLKGLPQDAAPLLYIDVKITDERYSDLMGKTVLALRSDFMFDPDAGPEVAVDPLFFSLASENFASALADKKTSFFNPETNAVVRAFETTRGKGIAGMITSLKFTWLDANNTWEVTRGSRAPMWCKVSIGMDIVHDLPLGMGHDGFMIAPAYPVGNINRRFFGTPYTSPSEPYAVPVEDGNDDLKRSVGSSAVVDQSSQGPDAAAAAATSV